MGSLLSFHVQAVGSRKDNNIIITSPSPFFWLLLVFPLPRYSVFTSVLVLVDFDPPFVVIVVVVIVVSLTCRPGNKSNKKLIIIDLNQLRKLDKGSGREEEITKIITAFFVVQLVCDSKI